MKDEKDISFYIVGSGVNEEKLKAYAKEKELSNVTFVGMQPPEDVADLYSATDVNVIPLQKGLIYAALPSKTADCLIAGKPIITCVDEGSKFAELAGQYGIQNAGTDQPEHLRQLVLQVKNGRQHCGNPEFWADYFTAGKGVDTHCKAVEQMR